MKPILIGVAVLLYVARPGVAQQSAATVNIETTNVILAQQAPADSGELAESPEQTAIRERLTSYVEAFNSHDAAAIGKFWTDDGVSVAAETGERTEGREALQEEFAAFFEEHPSARLTGEATIIRMIRPDVAQVEGQTTLFVTDAEPVVSAFSGVMIQEGDQWLISSAHERDFPAPATPYDALKEFEWLIGTWEDQTEGAHVTTTIRWSTHQAFLLRSFSAQFDEGDVLEGTQVIGWDPLNKQIRTWTFNSDGSFGQGTVSKHDDELIMKLWQVLADGRTASATKVVTRVDDDTLTVQIVGLTVDGEPSPTSDPVTVVRVADAAAVSEADTAGQEGETP